MSAHWVARPYVRLPSGASSVDNLENGPAYTTRFDPPHQLPPNLAHRIRLGVLAKTPKPVRARTVEGEVCSAYSKATPYPYLLVDCSLSCPYTSPPSSRLRHRADEYSYRGMRGFHIVPRQRRHLILWRHHVRLRQRYCAEIPSKQPRSSSNEFIIQKNSVCGEIIGHGHTIRIVSRHGTARHSTARHRTALHALPVAASVWRF